MTFHTDSKDPYPYRQALDECRHALATHPMGAEVLAAAQNIAGDWIQQFRPEEWPLVIRATLFATATIGGLEAHLHLPGPIGGMVRFHLNVQAAAACVLEDHMVNLDPGTRL